MARSTGERQRDQSTRRNSAPTNATRRDTTDRGASSADRAKQSATTGREDQERSIQAKRESARRDTSRPDTSRPDTSRPHGLSVGASASPFTAMRRMAEDMERLFDVFGVGPSAFGIGSRFASPVDSVIDREVWREPSSMSHASWSPHVEMLRRGDQLVFAPTCLV